MKTIIVYDATAADLDVLAGKLERPPEVIASMLLDLALEMVEQGKVEIPAR